MKTNPQLKFFTLFIRIAIINTGIARLYSKNRTVFLRCVAGH